MYLKELEAEFANPGAVYRGKPFWSWNGDLKEDELIRQIHIMKEMGLGGFFMHSRTGLKTEYLGADWFRLTNACADEAQRLGMEAWLYDEDRWPSGTAGGLVTENPSFRQKYMHLTRQSSTDFTWTDDIAAAFAVDLNGYAAYNCRRIWPDSPLSEYAGKTILVFKVVLMADSSFYNGNSYVDTLNREATDYFIDITHEQYRKNCAERLGRSIRGIFTDEPHRGAVFSGFGVTNEDRLWMTPWTDTVPALYKEQYGDDILNLLPDLFLANEGAVISQVKWRYIELLQQMFLDNFAKPLFDWCSDNDMLLTGHVLHEDSLTSQVCMQGSLMRFYEYMHCPGVDLLTESNRNYVIVKQLTSVARQLGQQWLLSELYGCTGWQMDFRSHKEVGDWQALLGINLRCHHLSWYTMEGEAKRDYPASILHQSAWWKEYGYVEAYFARLGLLLQQGKPVCSTLVISPVESLWCQVGVGWAEGLSPLTLEVQKLEQQYAELSTWLLGGQIDYDYGDEDLIARLSSVETNAFGHAFLRIGKAVYETVVVGGMTTIRSSTLELLTQFQNAGGRIVAIGSAPPYLDALPSERPGEFTARSTQVPWTKDAVLEACRRHNRPAASILDADTRQAITDIFCQERSEGAVTLLIALNTRKDQAFDHVVIQMPGRGEVEEWNCKTGERFTVPARTENGIVEFKTSFAESGERAFVLTPLADQDLVEIPAEPSTHSLVCDGPFPYTLGEENLCVLDSARFRLDSGPWSDCLEILQADRAVRTALDLPQRGGEMVQPWFRSKFESKPETIALLALEMRIDVQNVPTDPVFLCMERPELWRLTLNGKEIATTPNGWWVDAAFEKIALPEGSLRTGTNVLVLETDFRQDTNLEALYIIGDFGVTLTGTGCVLVNRPSLIPIGDLTQHGFPFYGGSITYHVPIPNELTAQALCVSVPDFEGACVKVNVPGGPSAMIAFPPYKAQVPEWTNRNAAIEVEVVLTRRNTFGPLHQIPLRSHAYGPDNFISAGDCFSTDYMLYPAGLLSPPILVWD